MKENIKNNDFEETKDSFETYLETYPALKKQKSSENAIEEYKIQIDEEQKILAMHPAKEVVLASLGFAVALCIAAFLFMLPKTGIAILFISFYGFAAATIVGLCVYISSFSTKHRKARRNIKRINKQIAKEKEVLKEIETLPSFDDFIKGF